MEEEVDSAGLGFRRPAAGGGVLGQLVSYGGVGVVAAGVDFSTFWLLTATVGLDALIANLISRTLGGCACFLLNKIWTFRQGLKARFAAQMWKFWAVFLLSLCLSELLLAVAIHAAGLPDFSSKIVVEALLFLLNFFLLRSWTFR